MIIFGSNARKIGDFKVANSVCSYCEQERSQHISVFGKYAHIFWIPLFPIGKKAVAECTHCKRTIEQKEFSPTLKKLYQENKDKAKRPIWHWSGLGILGLLIGLITIIGLTAEKDPRRELLTADQQLMIATPTMDNDSVSYKIKQLFDLSFPEEFNPSEFKYLTKTTTDKVLILVEIPKLRKFPKEDREVVIDAIERIAEEQQALSGKAQYIGVKGLLNMMLIKTPDYEDNSRVALLNKLLDFYGPKPTTTE